MDRIKLICTAFFIAYIVLLLFFVRKCVEASENNLKIERIEQEYLQMIEKSNYEYKDLSKSDLSKSNLSEKKRAYYDHLYKKCQE